MKPIRIDIENIFGIKKTSLDFPETGLIAIQGPNGAGKSSILDSIVVSLFGEPPASRDVKNSDILSRQASRGTLSFVFETENGKRFSVTRMYKRSKRGQVTQTAEMSLLDGDKEEGVATGPDAVNEYVASVIWNGQGVTNKEGRDLVRVVKNAFLSSVFLAQGEMTRFLKMTPSELREIISSLFVLEDTDIMKARGKNLFAIAEKQMTQVDAKEKNVESLLLSHPLSSMKQGELDLFHLQRTIDAIVPQITDKEQLRASLYEICQNWKAMVRENESLQREKAVLNDMEVTFKYQDGSATLQELKKMAVDINSLLSEKKRIMETLEKIQKETTAVTTRKEEVRKEKEQMVPEMDKQQEKAIWTEKVTSLVSLRHEAVQMQKELKDSMVKKKAVEKTYQDVEFNARAAQYLDMNGTLIDMQSQCKLYSTELKKVVVELEEKGNAFRQALISWLSVLAVDGVITVADIEKMDGVKFAATMSDSGLSKLVAEISALEGKKGTLQQRQKDVEEKIAQVKEEINRTFPDPTRFASIGKNDVPGKLSVDEWNTRLEQTKNNRALLDGNLTSQKNMYTSLVERGKALAEEIPDSIKNDTDSVFAASKKWAALQKEVRTLEQKQTELQNVLDKNEKNISTFEKTLVGLDSQKASLQEKRNDIFCTWKKYCATWKREDFVRVREIAHETTYISEEALNLQRQTVEQSKGAVQSMHNTVTDGLTRLETYIPSVCGETTLHGKMEKTSETLEKMEAELVSLREKKEELLTKTASIKQDMRSRADLEKNRDDIRTQKQVIAPAYAKAKMLSSFLDGPGFGNFVQDRALSVLVDYANKSIEGNPRYDKYSLTSEKGRITLLEHGEPRDVKTLSGGEATMVTLLLLRGMQSLSTGSGNPTYIDEGLSMLDAKNLRDTMSVLSQAAMSSLIMVITHDYDLALLFDTIWKVGEGGTVTVRTKRSLLDEALATLGKSNYLNLGDQIPAPGVELGEEELSLELFVLWVYAFRTKKGGKFFSPFVTDTQGNGYHSPVCCVGCPWGPLGPCVYI